MEYNIAESATREKLVDRVNFFIQKGWKPIGGVMYDFEDTLVSSSGKEVAGNRFSSNLEKHHAARTSMYCQAMIRE